MVKVPPWQIGDVERAFARLLAQRRNALFDLGDAHAVGVAQHRHDEALVRADGHADVAIMLVDDVGPVDLGVDGGDFLQRLTAGLHEIAHEAELHAVLLLEEILVFRALRDQRRHVDLVEGREHGGDALRLLEPARDGLAQPRHLHALLARGVVGRRRARAEPAAAPRPARAAGAGAAARAAKSMTSDFST